LERLDSATKPPFPSANLTRRNPNPDEVELAQTGVSSFRVAMAAWLESGPSYKSVPRYATAGTIGEHDCASSFDDAAGLVPAEEPVAQAKVNARDNAQSALMTISGGR
jgi:hypothetical protein